VGIKEYGAAQRTQIQSGQLVVGQGQFETIRQQQTQQFLAAHA